MICGIAGSSAGLQNGRWKTTDPMGPTIDVSLPTLQQLHHCWPRGSIIPIAEVFSRVLRRQESNVPRPRPIGPQLPSQCCQLQPQIPTVARVCLNLPRPQLSQYSERAMPEEFVAAPPVATAELGEAAAVAAEPTAGAAATANAGSAATAAAEPVVAKLTNFTENVARVKLEQARLTAEWLKVMEVLKHATKRKNSLKNQARMLPTTMWWW